MQPAGAGASRPRGASERTEPSPRRRAVFVGLCSPMFVRIWEMFD